jgi:predicted amidohydrolase YtcJ
VSRAPFVLENARVTAGADAVGVADGKVVAIGRRRDVAAAVGATAERIDCGGATLLPGLLDPHLHLYALASRHAELDCSGFTSAAALLAAVRARAAHTPRGAWLRGAGLDDAGLDRLPTDTELHGASPHAPVRLRHRSRHASLLSTGALRRLATLPDVVREARARHGLVAGREAGIGRALGPLAPEAMAAGLRAVERELLGFGLTTVADATPRTVREHGPLRALMRAGEFRVRVVGMRRSTARWPRDDRLRAGAVKLLVDEGSDGMRPPAAVLARQVARAARGGAQVAVHCVGAATLVAALAAFAALPASARRARRHRLEHLAECPPPLVAEIARLGLCVVTNPGFVYWRGDVYRRETEGRARAWLYRARSLLDAGIPLAGASDAPVVSTNPWIAIAAARTRRTQSGALLGGGERLGARAALALFTESAAWSLHAAELGRVAVGAPADLVVAEPDPLRAPADEVRDTRVRLTIADGTVAWQA